MFRSRLCQLGSLNKAAFPRVRPQFQPLQAGRRFLSNNNRPNDPNRNVRFRNFLALGIISWVILAQVVEAVNKQNRNSNTMSESEYFQQQMKLRRRKAIFTQDEKQVYFVKSDDEESLKSLQVDGYEIIDPSVLIEKEKQNEESLFHALLNDKETKKLPTGLLVDLITQALKDSSETKFIVINYPPDIKESIKFEEKVVTIKKLINLSEKEHAADDVLKYYKTVNKVEDIKSVDEIAKSL